jgi:hypothetical protein
MHALMIWMRYLAQEEDCEHNYGLSDKGLEFTWLGEQLLVSQEGFYSM